MIKLFLFLTLLVHAFSLMDPSKILQSLRLALSDNIQLLSIDIGRTVNGRTINAYGITKIKTQSHPPIAAELKDHNSILITSFFSPKHQGGVDLGLGLMDYFLRMHDKDYYLSYVLQHGVIWLIPYVNIDGYETLFRNEKENEEKLKNWGILSKNFNKMHLNPTDKCEQEGYGVKISANFMHVNNLITDPCSPDYGGPEPFTQVESKSIKYMYSLFRITTAINIEGFGNKWVHPYSEDNDGKKLQNHILGFLYKDIRVKLKKQNYVIGTYKELFNKQTNERYIDWAANNGVLAFSYFYGLEFKTPKNIEDSHAKQALPVVDMLVKKNAPVFNKYKNSQNTKLYIQSICIINFSIKIEVVDSNTFGQSISRVYNITPGQILEVNFQNYLILHELSSELHLQVVDTLLKEKINIYSLNVIPNEQVENVEKKAEFYENSRWIMKIVLVLVVVLAGISLKSWNQRKKQKVFATTREEEQKLMN